MGYQTDRYLEIIGDDETIKRFEKFCEENQETEIIDEYTYGDILNIHNNYDSSKWYSIIEDFKIVSRNWPTLKFSIQCKGEESEEYALHFWGGKHATQESKLVWEPFSFDDIAPLIGKLDMVLKEE